MNNKEALIVFSGGQDSTTCLFWALKHFEKVHTITFYYGQKHSLEIEMARSIAEDAGVDFHLEDVSFIGSLGSNSLTDTSIVMDSEKPSDTFLSQHSCRVCQGKRHKTYRYRCLADGFQRISGLQGCLCEIVECHVEPCYG